MANDDEASIIAEIHDKYVPFLKKLISFLEKTKKATPDNLNRLKSIQTVFTTATTAEQIDVFRANKKKLEKWFKNSQKDKMNEDGSTPIAAKRTLIVDDTDSSQGASENAVKRKRVSGQSKTSIPTTFDPKVVAEIKKEKVDQPKVVSAPSPTLPQIAPKPSTPIPIQPAVTPSNNPPNSASGDDNGQVIFTCASCQFQTLDEQEFMKHTRTDHRSDLSMWCKQCGKCFSNAGVLVSHIKERACTKEEMIYKCGVKECTFETTSGQTFVHHLRHCHKGSPFIFCVHCQKIFTLPHCLILHMQDDCPYKERNRRNPGSEPPAKDDAPPAPKTPVAPPVVRTPVPNYSPMTPTISSVASGIRPASTPRPITPTVRGRGILPTSRGRGRGRSRGRGRPPSESSDSDDPDDPSWRPEEAPGMQTLRRSGRWAKKVNDVINVEPKQSSKMSLAELNSKEMLKCPCCDFMATFQSVLHDHYIANHKVSNKNACLVCHLKFESTQGFLDHFVDHANGKLQNSVMDISETSVEVTTVVEKPPIKEKSDNISKINETPVPSIVSNNKLTEHTSDKISFDKDMDKCVLKKLAEVEVIDPTSDPTKCVKIPYQAAIHDKNIKDSKIKKFEDLKSPSDLIALKDPEKLKCFYKCVIYNCSFTTNNNTEYVNHLSSLHKGRRFYCGYCLNEFSDAKTLSDHMILEHSNRQYQCNNCFYRAYSKMHVQIHIKNYHAKDPTSSVYTCEQIGEKCGEPQLEGDESINTAKTAWPYICAIGECTFQTFDPKEFKSHNDTSHRSVTMFFCHYCKVDFISFKRLLNHYRLHGVNTFQCNYCIHGSETKDEILLHLCCGHPDKPLRALMRGSAEDATSESMVLPFTLPSERDQKNNKHNNVDSVRPDSPSVECTKKNRIDFEIQLYEVVGETYYPKYLQNICADFFCGVPWCRDKFENMLLYIGHLRNSHASMNFSCPHCPSVSENWDDFKSHLMCHGPELFACGLVTCNFYSWDKNIVGDHLKEHLQTTAKVVIVRDSDSSKNKENDMDKIRSLPSSCPFKIGEEFFQCFFCRYKSADKCEMKNHMYLELRYLRFSCSYCGKKCVSRKEIKAHCIKQHSGDEVKFVVDSHPEIENIVKKLLHQKIKSPDPKSIQCPICNKAFKSAIQWQRHLCLCAQNRYQPFDCGYCGHGVSDLRMLKFHIDEKHFPKQILPCEVTSGAVEGEINKKLLEMRLGYLNKILYKDKSASELQKLCFDKIYLCSACSYESNHKYNIQMHIGNAHSGIKAEISKTLRNVVAASLASNSDETSNDSVKVNDSTDVKRYRCGFCIKKLHTLSELETHVESLHPVRNEAQYFYYYSPDPKINFPSDDKELYECSYCKSGKENLISLKTHSDLMHSESPFKVRGYVIRNRDKSSVMSCGYCFQRANGMFELKRHTSSEHPALPVKSICGFQGCGFNKKRESAEVDDIPNKRVKFGDIVFICNHCRAAFSKLEEITNHARKSHSRLQMEYIQKNPSVEGENGSLSFYKCEFCQFISEKQYLETHLNAKHKMRVTCGYCNKRFEFATMLRKHHDVLHKGLPLKYSQETVGGIFIKKEQKQSTLMDDTPLQTKPLTEVESSSSNILKSVTYNDRRKPEPIDLSRVFMYADNVHDTPVRMSVLTYSNIVNISPCVILTDVWNTK